jgi:hypothetical protein
MKSAKLSTAFRESKSQKPKALLQEMHPQKHNPIVRSTQGGDKKEAPQT